ncbi:MAG: hypothetical protein P1V35_04770 [Planctomycetota bacterium]|nr:hypothetical protein [Planctomycetota bacterium]
MSQDPLDRLRQAWSQESQPMPPEDLQHVDADTKNKVEALRGVWTDQRAEHAPDLELLRGRFRNAQSTHGANVPMRLSMIAAFALAAGLLIWMIQPAPKPAPKSAPTQLASKDAPKVQPGQVDSEPSTIPKASAQIQELSPQAITYRDDGIELISGSVRLVLVTPSTPQTH